MAINAIRLNKQCIWGEQSRIACDRTCNHVKQQISRLFCGLARVAFGAVEFFCLDPSSRYDSEAELPFAHKSPL